ncbi:trypsin-like peptidase domain-containing protein [Planctomycetota bacterium]
MQEKKKGTGNNHLVAVLIALLALIVVAVFYWDRQQQRRVELSRSRIRANLLEDWGPGAQQQVQSALQAQGQTVAVQPQTVGFGKQVSFKNIIARVAPSVVSINVETGFLNQAAQPVPLQGQNVWGGRMGCFAHRAGGNAVCPNCNTKVPCQKGMPACFSNCPKCGTHMRPEGASWICPFQKKTQQVANQNTPPTTQQQFQAAGKGGSGVIVNRLGYVLTNHHVTHGAKAITVTVCSGLTTKTYPADVIDEAPELDFAMLKIAGNGDTFISAPIGNSSGVSVGDEVLAIGSPFGLQQTTTFGIVSNTRRTMTVGNQTYSDFIQTDAPLNPGSSGGALVSVNGRVIGINSAIYSPTQAFSGIGFARPIDSAKAVFPEFIDTSSNVARVLTRKALPWKPKRFGQPAAMQQGQGLYPWCPPGGQLQQVANKKQPFLNGLGLYPWCPPGGWVQKSANEQNLNTQTNTQVKNAPHRPWLGIRTRNVDQNVSDFLGLPMKFGILVMEVFDMSPCHSAGMRDGDVIMRLDKRSVKNEKMLWKMLSKKTIGDKIKLTVYRDGTKMNLDCKLGIRPTGISIPTFVKPRERDWQEMPAAALQGQAVAMTTPSTTNAPVPTGKLPSPRQQNAAKKEFIEGHWLGLEVIKLTKELATEFKIPSDQTGVLVDEITLEAAESGILAGDMVQSIGGLPTPDLRAFFDATQQERVQEGKQTDVGISRRGKKMTFVMTARNTTILGFAQMEAAQPIQPGALRPHRYMGTCTNCHIFMKSGGQLATDAGDILPNPPPITKNAKAPHRYRGTCATCHVIQ